MLFMGLWWYDQKDTEKYLAKLKLMTAERFKGEETSPKLVFGPYHFAGQCKGFSVYETNKPEELMALADFYSPELTFKFVPLLETDKRAEIFNKVKVE